jgi:DNA-directed RNA polymerase subunit beta'
LLKPSDGAPVTVPTQDMVLGIYYLTLEKDGDLGEGKVFKDEKEAVLAYDNNAVSLHAKVRVRRSIMIDGVPHSRIIETTVGRVILNEVIPQDIGFIDRSIYENKFLYEISFLADRKALGRIINRCINKYGSTDTAVVLDNIKRLGFQFSTRGALTVSISDMVIPEAKKTIIAEADNIVDQITKMFRRGVMTDKERSANVIKAWNEANAKISKALMAGLSRFNNIYMMANSGARGSDKQISQLAGMRGLMASPSGGTLELPIKANFREGLSVLEYFISAHGARKGLSDTALRTADSGYLTRRLVDVSQDIIIREWDCVHEDDVDQSAPGMWITAFTDGNEVIESLQDRARGRWAVDDILDPNTGQVIVQADTLISPDQAEQIEKSGVEKIHIRTILTCRSRIGLCSKCYGSNMASGRIVRIGESVGIIAAQSIGEPGTQLTMRTFHTGGIASNEDMTVGLPRVEEIFEARKPKSNQLAIIAEARGRVTFNDTKRQREVIITNDETGESKEYIIPYGIQYKVKTGDFVEAGDRLTEGNFYPHDMLRIKGLRGVQDYMLMEVQRVYRQQGVDINDKHIEVIVRQMLKRTKVEENGDSVFLPGSLVDWLEFDEANRALVEEGKTPAIGVRVLLGITKASLATDSFLSAASFQETTRVLTEAAIKGKIDPLIGLKENVIIGKLIPAGTGMQTYQRIEVETGVSEEEEDIPLRPVKISKHEKTKS